MKTIKVKNLKEALKQIDIFVKENNLNMEKLRIYGWDTGCIYISHIPYNGKTGEIAEIECEGEE